MVVGVGERNFDAERVGGSGVEEVEVKKVL